MFEVSGLQEGVQISIDNITLVGHGWHNFERFLNREGYVKEIKLGNYPYRYNYYMLDGSFFQVSEKREVRYEFNPNQCFRENVLKVIHNVMYRIRVTRLDVAVDYFGKDLSQYAWICGSARSKAFYLGRNGKLETLYIGGNNSKIKYRIYNKAKEQKKKGVWWRVECQRRFKKDEKNYIDEGGFFEDLEAVCEAWRSEGLSGEQKAILYFLEKEGGWNFFREKRSESIKKY